MSIATTTRIMDETDARLRAAKDDDEVRRIGIDHVTALGAYLATTAYLTLGSNPDFTVDQQAAFLQATIADLMANIEESFALQGMPDFTLLADHLEATEPCGDGLRADRYSEQTARRYAKQLAINPW